MKYKFLMPIVFSIIIGLFFGKIFFENYDNKSQTVFSEKEKVYMLQTGVYSSEEKMASSIKEYKKYLSISKDDGYHLYIGISKNKKIVSRLKEYYEKKGYSIYVKECVIENDKFISILKEYEKIIDITTDEDLSELEKIIISNYKELVLENET